MTQYENTHDLSLITKRIEEKWEKATLANNFIFYKVMRHHPDALQHLIELLLNIKVKALEFVNEETIDIDAGAKGIRLDIYAYDSDRVFDVELQLSKAKDLPKRARYYQGVMDVDSLKPGQKYSVLKESHVIFICFTDVFKNNLPISNFRYICDEDGTTEFGDCSYKHFFNAIKCAKLETLDEKARAFFKFLCGEAATDSFTSKLSAYVTDAKKNTQWRQQFMWMEAQRAYDYDDGILKGKEIGLLKGSRQKAEETARNALDMGLSVEQISKLTGLSVEEIEDLRS